MHPSKIESVFRMPILSKSSNLVLQHVPGVQSRMQLGAAENFAATSEWHKDQVLAQKSSIPGTSSQLGLSIAWNCDDALTRKHLGPASENAPEWQMRLYFRPEPRCACEM